MLRHRRTILFASVGFILLGGLLAIAWRALRNQPVQLVVPSGFRGHIQIIETANGGQSDGPLVVPSSGVLKVGSLAPFRLGQTIVAQFDDGTPLPNAMAAATPPGATVLVMDAICGGEEGWYWVGDLNDLWHLRDTVGKRSVGRPWRQPGRVASDQ